MKIRITLLSLLLSFAFGCTKTIDKKLNKKDFEEIKQIINEDESKSKMKKKYIIDNLSNTLTFIEIGEKINLDNSEIKSFKEEITLLSNDFDSILEAKLLIDKNNKLLSDFVELEDIETISISRYKGYFNMNLNFKNSFDKEIHYAILNYSYTDEYDNTFFKEKMKLRDDIANNFKDQAKITIEEKYNNAAKFMYTKVPQDKMKQYLMKGMKVTVSRIIFKDKSEIYFQNSSWDYKE